MAVVLKHFSMEPEVAELLEKMAKRVGKPQSRLLREWIIEKAGEYGLIER